MKTVLMTAAAAVAMISTPAFAEANSPTQAEQSQIVNISAVNPAKCKITAPTTKVALANNAISDDSGFARATVGSAVATALGSLEMTAWCTGSQNKVALTHSALVTGDGQQQDGFLKAVIYDLVVGLSDSSAKNAASDGTADGSVASNFPHFGATGTGAKLSFAAETASTSSGTIANVGQGGARASFKDGTERLVAGSYSGTVTLTINPGDTSSALSAL